jgi:HSP20 family protein
MSDRFSFDPFADLQNYREAIRQLLEGGWVLPRDLMPSAMNAIVVPVDVIDNGPELVIKASLPGVRPEDVMITVLGDTLTIKANIPEEEDFRGATYLRRERKAIAFIRSLTLPVSVESERSEARFKNGVLTLTLPKSESVRPRVIKVSSG